MRIELLQLRILGPYPICDHPKFIELEIQLTYVFAICSRAHNQYWLAPWHLHASRSEYRDDQARVVSSVHCKLWGIGRMRYPGGLKGGKVSPCQKELARTDGMIYSEVYVSVLFLSENAYQPNR